MSTSTVSYAAHEARQAFRKVHLWTLLGLFVAGLFSSLVFPLLPNGILQFVRKAFVIRTWTDFIVLNDYLAIYSLVFVVGLFDMLRVFVIPAEERYLDVILSKPLTRTQYLMSKALPTFAVLAGIGLVTALLYLAKIALLNGTAGFSMLAWMSGSLISISLALLLLSFVNLLFLFFKDVYNAVLVGLGVWVTTVIANSFFIYRPDIFAGKELAKQFVVFPTNLVWNAGHLHWVALILVPVSLVGAWGLLWLTGWILQRRDV